MSKIKICVKNVKHSQFNIDSWNSMYYNKLKSNPWRMCMLTYKVSNIIPNKEQIKCVLNDMSWLKNKLDEIITSEFHFVISDSSYSDFKQQVNDYSNLLGIEATISEETVGKTLSSYRNGKLHTVVIIRLFIFKNLVYSIDKYIHNNENIGSNDSSIGFSTVFHEIGYVVEEQLLNKFDISENMLCLGKSDAERYGILMAKNNISEYNADRFMMKISDENNIPYNITHQFEKEILIDLLNDELSNNTISWIINVMYHFMRYIAYNHHNKLYYNYDSIIDTKNEAKFHGLFIYIEGIIVNGVDKKNTKEILLQTYETMMSVYSKLFC